MSMTLDGSNGVTFNDSSLQGAAASPFVLKNRIINGDMRIDQRNAGASVTIDQTGGTYTLDRWYGRDDSPGAYSIQQVSDAPTGFNNSLKITITTTGTPGAAQYGFVGTWIEGYNTADLSFGSASAKTITLSFYVKSSVTGQFGGSITNSAQDRTYPFSYTISSANTWEQKSVTITGDTTGTWLTTNGAGIGVNFAVGIGSNFLATANTWASSFKMSATGQTNLYATSAATLQFTGVQLEIGSTATPFERRMFGQELALCQRYYTQSYPYGTVAGTNIGASGAGVISGVNYNQTTFGYTLMGPFCFSSTMRTNPTVTVYNPITGSSTASACIRNVNASTNVPGYVLSASDKSVHISCDATPVTIRAECAITATAEL